MVSFDREHSLRNASAAGQSGALIGLRVCILVDYPAPELAAVEEHVTATILAKRGEALLLRMDSPLDLHSDACRLILCSPRLRGATVSALVKGRHVLCNCTLIPPQRSKTPFDVSWWRGGGAFIGTVRQGLVSSRDLSDRGSPTTLKETGAVVMSKNELRRGLDVSDAPDSDAPDDVLAVDLRKIVDALGVSSDG